MTRDLIDFLLVILLLGALYGWAGARDFESAQVTEKIAHEVQEAREVSPCQGATMKQWAAGERWASKGEDVQAECAPAARRVPN